MSNVNVQADIYDVLSQFSQSYLQMTAALESVITQLEEQRSELRELREFVHVQHADVVTDRNIWKSVAEAHKAETVRLRELLNNLEKGN